MKDVNLTAVTCMGGCYVKKELDFLFVPEITIENMPSILKKGIVFLVIKWYLFFSVKLY